MWGDTVNTPTTYAILKKETVFEKIPNTQLTRETTIPYFLKFDYWDNHDHIGNRRRRLMQDHLFPIQVKKKSIQEFADDPLIINGIQMKIFAVESQREIHKTLLQEAEAIIELIEMEMKK